MPASVLASAPEVNDDAECISSLMDTAPRPHTLFTPPTTSRARFMSPLPRHARSRPSLAHASSSSLDIIKEDAPLCLTARTPSSTSTRALSSHSRRSGKSTALKESCGICFESTAMRNPDVARCCSQMFCHEHLADWLKRDGRCPACGEPLSLERGTVALRAPTRTAKPPALESGRLTARPRTGTFEFLITPNSTSSPSSSDGSDGEERGRRARCQSPLPLVIRPQYCSMNELAAALLPLRAVGVLLSLTGCALMVSVVLA